MTTPTYNLLAVRKTIGGIHHRIAEQGLDTTIRSCIILRQLQDLADTLPRRKFGNLVGRCIQAHNEGDTLEMVAGLALIESLLPHLTWGAVLAGTVVRIPNGGVYIKRKQGAEEMHTSALFKHFDSSTPINLTNL